ncbi:NUDIX hydrolase [Kitasatospora sp. NPDC088391]|uniref:NUDIX hydrolase n=1 Tax=Kitasatospora sp. NPDC088391 TaxID=3364074 RepID=UPI0037F20AA7
MSGRDVLVAAGVLFPDERGRVLVAYRSAHPVEVPGGGWEVADAAARATAVREVREEWGVTPVLRELACLDWSRDAGRPPLVVFLYWADPLTAEQLAALRPQAAELSGFAHLTADQLDSALTPVLARRVGACLRAPRSAAPLELADGRPVGHSALHPGSRPAPPYTGPAGLLPGAGEAVVVPPLDRAAYLAGLPRLRAKARMLFTDAAGRVLLLRLTPWEGQSGWLLPGGSVEADRELPRDAARRETLEELGWRREPGRLLTVDWIADHPWDPPHLSLTYDGGTVTPEQLAAIRLQEEEIVEWRLCTPAEAAEVLRPSALRRLTACLAVRALPPGAGPAELLCGAPPDGAGRTGPRRFAAGDGGRTGYE